MSPSGSPSSHDYHSPITVHVEDESTSSFTQRRLTSTGGGRAWSEEEETYLIETRLHKMPYKHIAAHLQKTELACRLHYHQLSFGTKRRRRNSSITSSKSLTSSRGSAEPHPTAHHQRPLPSLSPPNSPPEAALLSQSPQNPVPILPKPHYHPSPPLPPSSSTSTSTLHLLTQDIPSPDDQPRPHINQSRLQRIYDAHRKHFWTTIARDYGDNVSPAVLEDFWARSYAASNSTAKSLAHYPPTPPTRSPQETSPPSLGLGAPFESGSVGAEGRERAVGSGACKISALLTVDREVRSPGEVRG